jgi:thioredoxin reductase
MQQTMVVEPGVPGGKAGTSSLIRNYLGFRHGVSGEELAGRASEQAWHFGADIVLAQGLGQSKGWQQRWAKVPPPSA